MLISPRHLVDRLRYPRTRADALARLRARFATQPSAQQASPLQRQLAQTLLELRRKLSEAMVQAKACGSCAKGHPPPHGHWQGGYCCGVDTFRVFTPLEVASLKLAGLKPTKLLPPASDHAGCAFRGPTGCSLRPEQRPNICVLYLCIDLRHELTESEHWPTIKRLRKELADTQARLFSSLQEGSPSDASAPSATMRDAAPGAMR